MPVYVLADDLTGANDTVVQFVRRGRPAATVLDLDPMPAASYFAAQAYSTESRGLAAPEAYRRLRALLAKVAAGPEDLVDKKVDSALRGPMGARPSAGASSSRVCPELWRLAVEPADLSPGPGWKAPIRQAIAEILPHLSDGGAVVLTVRRDLPSPGPVLDPAAIAGGLGEIARGLAKVLKPGTLFLTGGDTVAAVCRRLAARALVIRGELAPGIIEAKLHGGPAHGVRTITKAGSFGDELSLVRIVERVCRH